MRNLDRSGRGRRSPARQAAICGADRRQAPAQVSPRPSSPAVLIPVNSHRTVRFSMAGFRVSVLRARRCCGGTLLVFGGGFGPFHTRISLALVRSAPRRAPREAISCFSLGIPLHFWTAASDLWCWCREGLRLPIRGAGAADSRFLGLNCAPGWGLLLLFLAVA